MGPSPSSRPTHPSSARPQARCADGNGTLTHLFFSDDPLDIARAKAICSKCKLAETCLEGALERAEPWGVWGGELIENGRIVVNKRPRGRPPKHPRPIVVIDEVPFPRTSSPDVGSPDGVAEVGSPERRSNRSQSRVTLRRA